MALSTIQFTQEQTRTLTGVTAGDLRHWRKSVPYLAAKPGKSARFTFTDLVALSITRQLIATYGVHIAPIALSVDSLFRLLTDARLEDLETGFVVVSGDAAELCQSYELGRFATAPVLVAPCAPAIAAIRGQVTPFDRQDQQAALPFPPHIVRAGA